MEERYEIINLILNSFYGYFFSSRLFWSRACPQLLTTNTIARLDAKRLHFAKRQYDFGAPHLDIPWY